MTGLVFLAVSFDDILLGRDVAEVPLTHPEDLVARRTYASDTYGTTNIDGGPSRRVWVFRTLIGPEPGGVLKGLSKVSDDTRVFRSRVEVGDKSVSAAVDVQIYASVPAEAYTDIYLLLRIPNKLLTFTHINHKDKLL